jgi:GNAT superfamily N-acetyltransferase
MHVREHADAASFAACAEPWLLRREAEHNLLLGLLPKLISGDHQFQQPIFLASIDVDGEVAGCAFRTPPFKLGLTRMPRVAVDLLADHVAGVYATLPAVLGPEDEATRFAERWGRRTGCSWTVGMRQRIHALARVKLPARVPRGALRPAGAADLPLLVEWFGMFADETGTQAGDARTKAEELLQDRSVHLWTDAEPRSMAAASGRTPHGVRVGYVYTPRSHRRQGYATAAVASLSDQLLRDGWRSCFLYTDLANPTSNAIYARIGYEPVCDVVDVVFSTSGTTRV